MNDKTKQVPESLGIQKIIVERIPDCCADCEFMGLFQDHTSNWPHVCIALDTLVTETKSRLNNCPLVRMSMLYENDPYWGRISEKALSQRTKGYQEYGRTIEEDQASIDVRLDRIQEELIDALYYLEHLRDGIKEE